MRFSVRRPRGLTHPASHWPGWVLFAVLLSVYVYFLCPTIAAGDSGELVNCAYRLGIPHPPGYPLYTMVAHLFTKLPFGSVAWRVNLFSAVATAGACLLVYLTLLTQFRRQIPALAGGLALGLSRYVWHYAEVAEVFPLNTFFAALLMFLLVSAIHADTDRKRDIRFLSAAFCFGLALCNHHTFILLGPAVLLFVIFATPSAFKRPGLIALGLGVFVLGLLPYFYLPLAAGAEPVINWDNPVNWEGFRQLVTRADYGSLSLLPEESSLEAPASRWIQIPVLFNGVLKQFGVLGVLLMVLGIWRARKDRAIQGYLLAGFFFTGIFFVMFANYPLSEPLLYGVLCRFYMLPAVLISLWVGYGALQLSEWLGKRVPPVLFTCVLLGVLGSWLFISNVDEADFRGNYIAEDHARNLLSPLPENALFMLRGDVESMGSDYLQHVLGERTDIIVLDQEKLTYPWYYEQVKKRYPGLVLRGERYDGSNVFNVHLVGDNIGKRSVFVFGVKEYSYQLKYSTVRVGLTHLMVKKGDPVDPEAAALTQRVVVENFELRGSEKTFPESSFEKKIKQQYAVLKRDL